MLSGFPGHAALGKGWDRDHRLEPSSLSFLVPSPPSPHWPGSSASTGLDCFLFSLRITVPRSFLDSSKPPSQVSQIPVCLISNFSHCFPMGSSMGTSFLPTYWTHHSEPANWVQKESLQLEVQMCILLHSLSILKLLLPVSPGGKGQCRRAQRLPHTDRRKSLFPLLMSKKSNNSGLLVRANTFHLEVSKPDPPA